ncbi:MAG: isoleucine--tRNA ligase [Mycoplasmatales bacterium]|nr:isoleucine--tRNA ligase [Mycoplasmatales bacterium]
MAKEWKNTLLMPQTNFEMKANLLKKEIEFRNFWNENKIYEKSLEQNKKNGRFQLHDGPPYANGSLHVGHALNKIIKDIIIRNKAMLGFSVPFTYGWDTHGLPIENKMLHDLGMKKDDLDKVELREKAAKYAMSQIDNQAKQFESMQLFANLKNRYITLNSKFETNQLKLFSKMILEGKIYKGLKPVYWSPSSQSALADAEVEYADHMSPKIIVAINITKGNEHLKEGDKLLIMTTTPWTLIANSGIAVGKKIEYAIVKVNNHKYVVSSLLLDDVSKQLKWENFEVLKTLKGNELVGIEYKRPIKRHLTGPVVLADHVTTEDGTGLVHMAPLFGEDDYIAGKANNLDTIMHVDDKGNLNSEADEYEGKFYADSNKDIGMFLDKKGELLSLKFIKHSYPHDWRTHKPIIYRGTPQWFVSINDLKEKIISELQKIKSNPEWGISRMIKMIENRSEWTISRQRTWGVPIIVFYDKDEKPLIKKELFDYVIEIISKEGTDVWWKRTTDELLPESYRGKGYTREMDIMDVWFDSGSSFLTPQTEGEDLKMETQYDVYFEGSDQYRGWFNSSLINSVAKNNQSPFKKLISHGFVLDGKQQKMSKSKGNVIDPLDVINKNGAEILRLWAANSEYTSDVAISDDILKQNIEIYRRIRNSIKFMLGNLFDFSESNKVELKGIHALIAEKLDNLKFNINKYFQEYRFINVVKEINHFLIEMSGFYFEISKDSLYVEKANNYDRRATQTNIYNIVSFVIKAISSILPTTAEEAYQNFNIKNKKESIFLEKFEKNENNANEQKNKWKEFFILKDEIYKLIEKAKKEQTIRRSNEVLLTVKTDSEFIKSLDLSKLLMVAKVKYGNENKVSKFESSKCQRCWNHFYKEEINNDLICSRCEKVVKK